MDTRKSRENSVGLEGEKNHSKLGNTVGLKNGRRPLSWKSGFTTKPFLLGYLWFSKAVADGAPVTWFSRTALRQSVLLSLAVQVNRLRLAFKSMPQVLIQYGKQLMCVVLKASFGFWDFFFLFFLSLKITNPLKIQLRNCLIFSGRQTDSRSNLDWSLFLVCIGKLLQVERLWSQILFFSAFVNERPLLLSRLLCLDLSEITKMKGISPLFCLLLLILCPERSGKKGFGVDRLSEHETRLCLEGCK